MRCRPGQVAVYLVLVLVAVCILALMNVGVYLAVSAKNRAMNAGDAAALAVAKHQGELLNRIGALNVEHIKAALEEDAERCGEIVREQLELSLLGPVEGIQIGGEAARRNGVKGDNAHSRGMRKLLMDHALDVRRFYVGNPDVYPEPWDGAWDEYARRIEIATAGEVLAGPDNIDFLDAVSGHMLLNRAFYSAIEGMTWCWFHFNAPGLLDSYSSFRDWAPLPGTDDEVRRRRSVNSEIYSLGLRLESCSIVERLSAVLGDGAEAFVAKLAGVDVEKVRKSSLLADPLQKWFFYDDDKWRRWWEIDPNGEWQFPAMGRVKREYDVRGCAAVCRVYVSYADVVGSGEGKAAFNGAAKPFGTVEGADGAVDVVTALGGFVVPAFTDVRLVPVDAVGGRDLATADPEWMNHVKEHLGRYLQNGPTAMAACWYCRQLRVWELESFRQTGGRWLRLHAGECVRSSGTGTGHGGTPHGH